MSVQSGNSKASRKSLRDKTRESFRKIRNENRTKINKSVGMAYYALRDVRSTARQTLSNVKSAVENISNVSSFLQSKAHILYLAGNDNFICKIDEHPAMCNHVGLIDH